MQQSYVFGYIIKTPPNKVFYAPADWSISSFGCDTWYFLFFADSSNEDMWNPPHFFADDMIGDFSITEVLTLLDTGVCRPEDW